jgi:phosphotransferase system HPr-like phosphotransfer protein
LNLAAAKGTRLKLIVEGVDEEKASAAVEEIFAGGFGEL